MSFSDVQTDLPHGRAARQNVLIVEDERVSRTALAALLTSSGYGTQTTSSAEEALAAVNAGSRPDIALVDLDLPGMNGLDFIGRLALLDPSVFAVLITASTRERLSELLAERGVAYMRKPVNFDGLLNLLSKAEN